MEKEAISILRSQLRPLVGVMALFVEYRFEVPRGLIGRGSQSLCLHWAWCSGKRLFLLNFCFFGTNSYLKAFLLTGWFSDHPKIHPPECLGGLLLGTSLLPTTSTPVLAHKHDYFVTTSAVLPWPSLALPFCVFRQGLACLCLGWFCFRMDSRLSLVDP